MNKELSRKIEKIIIQLEKIQIEIESIQKKEQDSYDNLPEILHDGNIGIQMIDAIEYLAEAMEEMESLIDTLSEVKL